VVEFKRKELTLKVAWFLKILMSLIRRPSLWPVTIKQLFKIAKTRWFLSFPFLPIPSKDFIDFRVITYQGDKEDFPNAKVVITWLDWVADMGKSKT